MSLTIEERRNLRALLVVVLPEDEGLWTSSEHLLSDDTLEKTERFLAQCTACTKRMQKLFLDLAGGLTRGWLRRVLREASKEVAKESSFWTGNVPCYVTAKSRWRSDIVNTLI